MKNFAIIFLLIISFHCEICYPQNGKLSLNEQVDSLMLIKQHLKKEQLSQEDKDHYSNLYYKYFPSSFNRFNAIFGYTDLPDGYGKANPLYYESMEYIDLFADILNKKHDLYWSKLISLSCGAHWDADAINILQEYIQTTVKENTKDFCLFLSGYSSKVISDFWHFYFDGPHPENYKEDYEVLYSNCKAIDPNIAELMKKAYGQLLSEHNNH